MKHRYVRRSHRKHPRLERHPAAGADSFWILTGGMAALLVTLVSAFYLIGRFSALEKEDVVPEQFIVEPISLEPYCRNGYYEIPGEPICSRAPYCGGYGYDELNTEALMPNPQSCMGDGPQGRAQKGCTGMVPLCCYEMARTGRYTKCIGYWERIWCTKSQCDDAVANGASHSECGGNDCGDCGHAFKDYCGDKPPIPLSQRLGLPPAEPTATQAPGIPPSPTPTNTAGPPPTQPPVPTATGVSTPTKRPKPTLTPKAIVRNIQVTIPVMVVKLGAPSPAQNFVQWWIQVFFQLILPGSSPVAKPTPKPPPDTAPTPTELPGGATATPDPAAPLTATPTPTATPVPLPCPGTSSRSYSTISVNGPPTDRPASQHPDLNIYLRGFIPTTDTLGLVDIGGPPPDPKAPQLATLLDRSGQLPEFKQNYRVTGWDGTNFTGPITDYDVTMTALRTNPGENLHVPTWGDSIGGGKAVMVLYTTQNTITLKYTREDNVVSGYTLHIDGFCTDPNLFALYQQQNTQGRNNLPALGSGEVFGTAQGSDVRVVIRDTGSFMDPRSRRDWWQGY